MSLLDHTILIKMVREGLQRLSDADYQRRAWLSVDGPVVSSFVEDVCHTFDDSGLGDLLDSGVASSPFDEPTLAELRSLDALLSTIDGNQNVEALLRDPALALMRSQAQACLASLERSR